jgi:hypothetical protein
LAVLPCANFRRLRRPCHENEWEVSFLSAR